MNIVLLSGGSGTRLWPLSNEVRSKQFLRIFRKEDGSFESMVQRVYRLIRETNPDARIMVATMDKQVEAIRAQLGNEIGISTEPCRRNTFPAIALATAYLHDKMEVREEEVTVVCPIDSFVDGDFFASFRKMEARLLTHRENLVLLGIQPTYPSEKYGYIVPVEPGNAVRVREFTEKPNRERAEELLSQGALWNGGVFAFRVGYVLEKAREQLGTDSYDRLFQNYGELPKISFDYAVSEHEPDIGMIRYDGTWEDIGTWDTLTKAMSSPTVGDVVTERCEDVSVINELGVPLVAFGLKNTIIAASPDGILVSGREASPDIRGAVEGLIKRPMFEEKEWGRYSVLDYSVSKSGIGSLTKSLIIRAGSHISYHTHAHRSEHWTVTSGRGSLIIDGRTRQLLQGDTCSVQPGTKHAIYAETELHIIEVQLGDDLSEEDIRRLDWDWSNYG